MAKYHRRFPSVRRLADKNKSLLIRQGYVANPFGRRYHINPKKAYTVTDYLCQGTSADVIKRAMVKLWKWLRKEGYKTNLILQVHDELVFEIPADEEKIVVPMIRNKMQDLKSFFVPITVDAEVVSERWSEKHKPEEFGIKLKAA